MNDVLILIPNYNNLEKLQFSFFNIQDFCKKYKFLIVDDGSIKNITEGDFAEFDLNIDIRTLNENYGIEYALNVGINYAVENEFKYIARLDSGDYWDSEKLEKQIEFLNTNPEYALVGTNSIFFDDASKAEIKKYTLPISYNAIKRKMHINSCFIHSSVLIRISALKDVGYYSEKYKYAEDMELFFRIMQKYKVCNLNEYLTHYETNDFSSISYAKRRKQIASRIKIQIKYFNWSYWESYFGIIRSIALLMFDFVKITERG